jgi:Niemann-Pick C1 protein
MFVIVQCLDNLKKQEVHPLSVHERIAVTMKHAGVAITVTSLTDICAFGVGTVTVGIYSN